MNTMSISQPGMNIYNSKKIIVLASLLPIAVVVIYIFFFGLNIPFGDQWDFFSDYIKFRQNSLTFADLMSQHNEHRPFFPRLIWLGLANLTQYNVNTELWTNLFIQLTAFIFFSYHTQKFWHYLGVKPGWWSIPLISLVTFNLGQWESWLVGFQTVMYLGTSSIIIGFFLLSRYNNWPSFLMATLLGIIATFSMVNGVFYWIFGLFLVILCSPRRLIIYRSVTWLIFSLIFSYYFFDGWRTNSHVDFFYLLDHFIAWIIWILNFLGAPIFTFWYIAWIFGLISLLLFIKVFINLDRQKLILSSPYLAIAGFVILTSFAVSCGRFIEDKPSYSVISRYLTMSSWYWAALFALMPLFWNRFRHLHWLYLIILASLIALMLGGAWVGYERQYLITLPAYRAVKTGQTVLDHDLIKIYPDPDKVRNLMNKLNEHKLSIYSDTL